MSSNKLELSHIAKRILELSASYATDKEFLKVCDISNLSFVTDVKKGRANSPGADKLAQIVRGTGCSGTWLLTGKGKKFPPDRPDQGMAASPGEAYVSDVMQARHLIERIEQKSDAVKDAAQLGDLAVESSKLTTKLLELQRKVHSERG